MKFVFYTALLALLFGACMPTEDEIFAENVESIENYLSENNLNAEVTEAGLHYIIKEAGSVNHPNAQNQITVDYRGYLLDGTTFESGTDSSFELPNAITGWQVGVPLIGKGGEIMLLIPSRLAYGEDPPDGSGIPADVPLLFDITLKDFN